MSVLTSLKNQKVIADKCYEAVSFFDRLRGLIGRTSFAQGEAMFFPHCNDIHMWFMRISIDVVFVKYEHARVYQITRVCESVKPWRVLPLRDSRASETIELPAGTIGRLDIRVGDELCIS
jgi:uncharacterized membrane protein (UPF0127 family)